MLVTGGAGFIGSELVRQLAESVAEIVVIDNLVNGSWQNLEGISSVDLRFVEADIRDAARMRDFVKGYRHCLSPRVPGRQALDSFSTREPGS